MSKKNRRNDYVQTQEVTYYETKVKPLKAATENQKKALNALNNPEKKVILLTGYTRTGKTYLPTCFAADALRNSQIKKLILTRPYQEAEGESMGFLKGDKEEKFEPYLRPFKDVLETRIDASKVKSYLGCKMIEPFPIGFMRSMTFHDAFIILDEAQNTTTNTIELVLTRLGENSRIVVCGDYRRQKDISAPSGLKFVADQLKDKPYVAHINFTLEDIFFPLVRDMVETFYNSEE